MEVGQIIISLVSVIVMFIPIGGIFWKIAEICFKVDNSIKDLDNLGKKVRDNEEKFNSRFYENEVKLANIENIMGRLEEKINLLLDKKQ